jgi:flagellar hook protein FlgE
MRTGVSGMNAQANKLGTVADNIANVNTVGYKRAATEFTSLILKSGSGTYNSGGVETSVRYAISDPGPIQYTTSATDLAISGNGFFVVSKNAAGTQQYLTRAGSFVPDSQGNLVNTAGFYLMGQPGSGPLIPGGPLQVVNVFATGLQANASTLATVSSNLDADAAVLAGPPTAPPYDYTSKTSLVTYDNIGHAITLDIYMTKTGPNTWDIRAFDSATATAGGFPYSSAPLDANTFTFDVSATGKGRLDAASPTSLNFTIPGGVPFTLDLSAMTQVSSPFAFKATVDGNKAGAVDSVEIASDGSLYMIYDTGARVKTYTIPVANLPSPDKLKPEVGNVYSQSADSGAWQTGQPGVSGLGTITSNALEQSNADLGTELTNMIESQRGYTANSKVFQTGADLLDVLVNLKR